MRQSVKCRLSRLCRVEVEVAVRRDTQFTAGKSREQGASHENQNNGPRDRTDRSVGDGGSGRGQSWIGWCAHYSIGITFSALLLWTYGLEWARPPSVLPALFIGIATMIAPLLILQPAMGAGIASCNTPRPFFHSFKSLATHTVFGLAMYLAALAAASLLPFGR
jgi:hypothetical protein